MSVLSLVIICFLCLSIVWLIGVVSMLDGLWLNSVLLMVVLSFCIVCVMVDCV